MLETLGATSHPIDRLEVRAPAALLYARTCYDHLAGGLAVRIHDQLLTDGHLDNDSDTHLHLTTSGEDLLASIGVDIDAARALRRPMVRGCLDWTQRRHHVAGAAAAAMLKAFIAQSWIRRGSEPRTVNVTDRGRAALHEHFNLDLATDSTWTGRCHNVSTAARPAPLRPGAA